MQIDFMQLNQHCFDISNIFAAYQLGQSGAIFETVGPRPTNALLYFHDAIGICTPKNEDPFEVPCGSVVLIPHGSEYSWKVCSPSGKSTTVTMLFEFNLKCRRITAGKKGELSSAPSSDNSLEIGTKIQVIANKSPELYKKLFLSLINAFNAQTILPIIRSCYELFEKLAGEPAISDRTSVNNEIISKSLRLMENDSANTPGISEIAAACGVSAGYFSRLFKKHIGISAIEHLTLNKLAKAKRLLSESTLTVDRIAELSGFSDSAYMCRVFKKKSGITPGEYRNFSKQM